MPKPQVANDSAKEVIMFQFYPLLVSMSVSVLTIAKRLSTQFHRFCAAVPKSQSVMQESAQNDSENPVTCTLAAIFSTRLK